MASPRSLIYLAYGSNLHPRRLCERIGDIELAGVVYLPGWRLCFDKRGADGSAKANLRPVPGSNHAAWAAAYRVRLEQLPALDRFEGCGGGYETFRFDVELDRCRQPALAYLTPSHWTSHAMRPFDWYRKLIAAGAQYHGLPTSYLRMITGGDSIADPDSARARQQAMLIARIEAHQG